ncbi:MAG: hypothetical protein EZS28_013203 [Streblomastix strix]|uniref:Uncharacterized protein n=1 Tax=Streblomastix strix TaxID=222440 RepID=A0A5J4W8M0_9EUKA|nr:MAG: hypothetical protein EZS28_013203 [Streblomastix strix]
MGNEESQPTKPKKTIGIKVAAKYVKNEDLNDEQYLKEIQTIIEKKEKKCPIEEAQNNNTINFKQTYFIRGKLKSFIETFQQKQPKNQQQSKDQSNIQIETPPSQKIAHSLQKFGSKVSQLLNALISLPHDGVIEKWETSEAFAEGLEKAIMRYLMYMRDPLLQNKHIWGTRILPIKDSQQKREYQLRSA